MEIKKLWEAKSVRAADLNRKLAEEQSGYISPWALKKLEEQSSAASTSETEQLRDREAKRD